jgi:hypothetical protein
MAPLPNPKHEKAAKARARGKSKTDAYKEAGYQRHPQNASRMMLNDAFENRVAEIQQEQYVALTLERKALVGRALENVDIAMGKKPVKVGKDGVPVYVYRGDVANNALKLAGNEIGVFQERKELKITANFEGYSDHQLVELLAQEAQALLEDQSQVIENDAQDSEK